jgi:hypothetical protein
VSKRVEDESMISFLTGQDVYRRQGGIRGARPSTISLDK